MTNSSITLRRGRSKPIFLGHPWVFSGAIAAAELTGSDLVQVFDDNQTSIGWGLYSEHSDIRVRMVRGSDSGRLGRAEFESALLRALERRRALGLPNPKTNVFRLVNSEGDGLPGLIVDVLGSTLSVQVTTAPMARRLEAITEALATVFPNSTILAVPAPPAILELEKFEPSTGWLRGEAEGIDIVEGGVRFSIDPKSIQKTGHYADMRIHRQWFASIASGESILDAYSYTGGFGLHAAVAGAREVVCIDSSRDALERAKINADLNQVAVSCVVSKVDDFLRSSFDKGKLWSRIVLDPPKLAPSRKHADKALKVYESLAVQALRVLEPGGVMAIGSCSEAIGLAEIERIVASAVARVGRSGATIYLGTQSPDHPYPPAMPEARYLTFWAGSFD